MAAPVEMEGKRTHILRVFFTQHKAAAFEFFLPTPRYRSLVDGQNPREAALVDPFVFEM